MPRPLLSSPFSFINTFLFFSIFFFPTYVSSDGDGYTACAPFSCGNFTDISYPFRISNQPDYCGHPKFKLDCQQDNMTIDINSQKFLVIDINKKSKLLKIARLDLWGETEYSSCPKQYINVSLDSAFFNYTSNDGSYTLFYDCGPLPYSYPVDIETARKFYCLKNRIESIGFLVLSTEMVKFIDLGCKDNIMVPVLKEAFHNSLYLGDILDQGFEVRWSGVDANKCDSCIKSGGKCGYNASKNAFMCLCPNQQSYDGICSEIPAPSPLQARSRDATGQWNLQRKIIIGSAGASFAGLLCVVIFCLKNKSSSWHGKFWWVAKNNQDIEAFLKNHRALSQKRYKFLEVKKITNSFKVELGQGGFGIVYKGKLPNGCPVAVKILNASKGNGAEFINEVASISRTSHVNVVTLLGFCFEGRKKALIYEFMPNGSLNNFIYNKGPETIASLSWENLYQIAKGIARGLEYLHRGCNTQILHFDIKPHNILLDENFCPKISDFGLAKLCPKKESIISMSDARGTMGYVAPEVWHRHFGGVSHKSDVYSYGMMLLEMVGGRKNINVEANDTSEIYFPHWVYNKLKLGSDLRPDEVMATEENEIARRMTIVGLWCIQTFPNDRPTINRVIDMLECSINSLEIPPEPMLSSPTRSLQESSTS